MIYKVTNKQYNADDCFVCGIQNDSGLHMHYYELNQSFLLGVTCGKNSHQSYPKRMHGGIITALLDETIGRAISIDEPMCWGVTTSIEVKFRRPVSLDETIYVLGYITKNRSRTFEGYGVILASDKKTVLAESNAKYLKQDIKDILGNDHLSGWQLIPDDKKEFELFYEFIRSE
ncbi:MAG TPA: PaaI family thioesterase [Acholeplasmataceae bacterium]|jgi:hypothetical protein|nr:PaaI family thioesterase [Acholeplasmataceae bacterium]